MTATFTLRELNRLRRALRAAVDLDGHVLQGREFRRLARVIARLDRSAVEIATAERTLVAGGGA